MADNCELNLFASNTKGEMLTSNGTVTTNQEEAAISTLYTDLMNIQKDRSWAISLWSLAHDPTFLSEYSDSLSYDSVGEVTASSLMNTLQSFGIVDAALTKKLVESRTRQFNKELEKQNDNKQQLKTAIELATVFNTNESQGIKGFSALIEYKNPSKPSLGYKISIVAKTNSNANKFNRFMKHQNLLAKIQYRLAQLGLKAGFLDIDSNSRYVRDLDGAEYAHTGLLTLIGLSQSPSTSEYTDDVLMQTARLLIDIIADNPSSDTNNSRLESLLNSLTKQDFLEYYQDSYTDAMFNNPARRKEVAAYILSKALKADTGRNFFTRTVNWIKHLFKKLNRNSVVKDREVAYTNADKIAREFLSGAFENTSYAEQVLTENQSIYSQDGVLGTPKISGVITEAYKAIIDNLRRLADDMSTLNPSVKKHYENLLRSLEADISVVNTSAFSDIMSIQNIIDACRRLSDEFPAFMEKLSKLDFEHQGTPVEEVVKYQTVREISQFLDYVREIQAIIDDLLKDREIASKEVKALFEPLLNARRLLDNFLTSRSIDNLSLAEVCERKKSQCIARFLENVHGKEYIEIAARVVGEGGKLVSKKAKYIYFDRRKAEDKRELLRLILNKLTKSSGTLDLDFYNHLPQEGKQLWDNVISKKQKSERVMFVEEELAKVDEGMKNSITDVIDKDLNWFNTYIESMSNNPDIMGQLLDKSVKEANSWANNANIADRNILVELSKEWDKIAPKERTSVLYEKDENGQSDGYLVSRYNTGKWVKDYDAFLKQATLEFYETYPMYKPKQDIFGDDIPVSEAAKLQYQLFMKRKKNAWHREHSHYDEQLQQYRPGKKVAPSIADNVDRISGTFGDETSPNTDLASYNNGSKAFQEIEEKSNVLADRDAGQYRGTDGSRHVRFHRLLQNIEDRQASTIGDSPITGESMENAVMSRQKGSRVDELLRVLFESKGQDIEGAKKAANKLEVDVPEGFPITPLEEAYMNKVINEALALMHELANRGIKWSARNLRVSTNIKGLNVAGEMDLLLEYPDGTLEPWDFKTSNDINGRFTPEKNENYKAQVNFYNKCLKDSNYRSRVGGLIMIDAATGSITVSRLKETSLENWRVEPFELRHEEEKGFPFVESVKAQLEIEQQTDFEGDNPTYDLSKRVSGLFGSMASGGTSGEIIEPPTATINLEDISRQQALDIADKTEYYEDVRWLIDKEGYTPYDALAQFNIAPRRVEDVPKDYLIDPDGEYTNRQYESMPLEQRKILKKILDYKFNHDSQYPKGAVKYALAPQVRGRTINKLRNNKQHGGKFLSGWKVIGHNISNEFVRDADDYEFGDDLTYNGDESSMIASNAGFVRDRMNRIPVLGVNPIIDPKWKSKLKVYKQITDLYDSIHRIESAPLASLHTFTKNAQGTLVKQDRTEQDRQALIKDYQEQIEKIALANDIKDYTEADIRDAQKKTMGRSATELSTEVFHSLMVYSVMSNKYRALRQIVDVAEIGSSVVRKRKVKRGSQNYRAYDRWRSYVDKEFYNVQTEYKSLGILCINKLAGIISRFASGVFLKGNTKAGLVNLGTGIIELYKEALVGQFIDTKSFRKAIGIYFSYSYSGKRLSHGGLKDYHDDFLSLFLEKYNTQRKNESKFYDFNPERSGLLKLNPLGDKFGYLPFEEGDRVMQSIIPIALALDTQVYDTQTGEVINLFEANKRVYEKNPEGVNTIDLQDRFIKNPEDAQGIKVVKAIENALEEYQVPENREDNTEARISNYLRRKLNATQYNWYLDNMQPIIQARYDYAVKNNIRRPDPLDIVQEQKLSIIWNTSDDAALEQKSDEINIRLHGIYNTIDKVKFQQNIYGNMVLGMRGYVLGALEKGFAGSKYNAGLETDTDGEFSALSKMFMYVLTGMYNETGQKIDTKLADRVLTAWKANIFSNMAFTKLRRAEKRFLGTQKVTESGFSESQYYAMRRAQIHVSAVAAIVFTAALVKGLAWKFNLDDDEDDEKAPWIIKLLNNFFGWVHYLFFRWGIEQMAYSTPEGLAKELPSSADVVPIGLKAVLRTSNIAELLITGDRYAKAGAGYKKDDLKGVIQLERMTPWLRDWLWLMYPWASEAGYMYQQNKQSDYRTKTNLLEEMFKKILDRDKYEKEAAEKESRSKKGKKSKGKKKVYK